MSDFINTIDVYGDKYVLDEFALRTIDEFRDDVITILSNNAFYNCLSLRTLVLPKLKNLKNGMLTSCSALRYVDFSNITDIVSSTLKKCSRLSFFVLRNETLVTLTGGVSVFSDTLFASGKTGGTLLVPRDLVESYKTATNWSSILSQNTENRFLPLEDYTVDGTITGDIDFDLFTDCMAREFIKGTFYGEYVSDTIVNVKDYAFNSCYFKRVIVPNALTAGNYAFNNDSIEHLDIRSMTTMGEYSIHCTNLKTAILPATPPDGTKGNIVYSGTAKTCIFYVPTGSLALYQAHEKWSSTTKNYIFIEEDR